MKSSKLAVLLGASCGASIMAGLASPAYAQSAPGADESAEIVVTAQKREERLQDVPSSIAVLGGADLQSQSADTLEDYVARVPGLSLNARGLGQQQLTIRGISTGAGYASTVATYIDEAPVGASNGDGAGGLVTPEIDSIDLSRVEILRGPQGTLYGASNIGGLLKYVTVAPNLSRVEAAASLEGSTVAHGDEGFAVRGRVSVPLVTDKVALLASGYIRRDAGFVDDDGLGRKDLDAIRTKGWRVALAAEPVEALRISLATIGTNKNANGFTQIDADPATLESLYGDYDQRRAAGSEFQRTRVRLHYATIAYDLGWGELSSTTSYNQVRTRSSEDQTSAFAPFFPDGFGFDDLGYAGAYAISQNKLTEELRLAGKVGDMFDFVLGGYYSRERSTTNVSFPTFDAVTGEPINIGVSLLQSTAYGRYREYAGFAQGTVHFTPELEITGGIRYSENRQRSLTISDGLFAGGPSTVENRASGSATTFTVAPSYKITPDVTLYARVATGYRPGGSNGTAAPVEQYDPDRVTNYEAGIKGSFDGGRVTFELAGFYVDWTKLQLRVQSPDTGLSYTDNVGKASSRGVEANLAYKISPEFSIGATGSYVDAKLDRDIPSGQFGFKGDPLPYAPKWKIAANADFDKEIGPESNFFAGASLYYTSAVSGEFRTVPDAVRSRLPGYVTFDARTGITKGPWTLSLLAKNLFDKRGFNGVTQRTLDADGPVSLNIIQPRTFSVALRYQY
ncbi:outer membrane receptor protein involved in Fe transport [Sphingopyxis panaciterrae]|uniref:TonB-dependent receptor n=1 Tax=Sphingopyxis panaciterrae TaxID=363841 RepID=UPI001421A232|nr:TonB-dependent receptor [Sphingopyxis panaciterrae]NIJ37700.1 outer membrane receptor protein involved in Fe transport [Sphingopyxis panaciterrae]